VIDQDMEYLYSDGEFWHFMHPETHEQIAADKNAMVDAEKWLKGNETCIVTLWNGAPLTVSAPNFVELTIVETDPGVKGDTPAVAENRQNSKPARPCAYPCSCRTAKSSGSTRERANTSGG